MLDQDRNSIYADASLTPDEIKEVESYLDETALIDGFQESSAYEKLTDYFSDEMPIGVAMCNDGEPDVWILEKLEQAV